jgi:hypothetical protein
VFALERLWTLDRAAVARRTRERFSVARMADRYEAVYARVVGEARFGRFRAA